MNHQKNMSSSVSDYEHQLAIMTGKTLNWVMRSRLSDYRDYPGAAAVFMRYNEAKRKRDRDDDRRRR